MWKYVFRHTLMASARDLQLIKQSVNHKHVLQLPANIRENMRSNSMAACQTTAAAEPVVDVPAAEQLTPEEREQRIKVLKLELEVAYQEGRRVPPVEFVSDKHWEAILEKPTHSSRFRYYIYLFKLFRAVEAEKRKKQEHTAAVAKRREEQRKLDAENKHISYGLNHVTFFLRIYDTSMDRWNNNRLISAMQFAPKLVFDCSFDSHMTPRECDNTGKQLMLCFRDNRENEQPFDVHLCNARRTARTVQSLQKWIPSIYNPEFPLQLHQQCFSELFPRERLVYLTPHCDEVLDEYNPDDIYIVGGIVDKTYHEPVSLAKAKSMHIRMAKLPLERYLQWGSSAGKALTLDQMMSIMLDLKNTGNWERALQHVPRRKLANPELVAERAMKLHNFSASQKSAIEELVRSNQKRRAMESAIAAAVAAKNAASEGS